MPFSHNGLKTTKGIQVFSQVNKYTLSYRFLYGNVQGCVFAKNRPVSLNWTDYILIIQMRGGFINDSMIDFVNIEISLRGIHCYNILDFLT